MKQDSVTIDDRDARESVTHWSLPDCAWSAGWPLVGQLLVVRDAVAIGAENLGPVACVCSGREQRVEQ